MAAFLVFAISGGFLEQIFHRRWRDYSHARFHFQGYLNFFHLLFFGAAAVVCVWFVNPALLDVILRIPRRAELILGIVLTVLMIADVIFCAITIIQMHHSAPHDRFLDRAHDFAENFGNALTRKVQQRMTGAYPEIRAGRISEALKQRKKSTVFAEGCSFYKLACLFFVGSVLGDLTETIFCRLTAGVWMSRSSLVWGPFSIVWGFGCSILTALLYRYRNKSDRYIFLYGTVLGGFYEYVCSVISERLFGTVFWDYSSFPLNLGGRINLLYCFFWGIAAVVWMKGLYPVFSGWIEKIPRKPGKIITWAAIAFISVDMAVSALALYRYNDRLTHPEPDNALEEYLDTHFDDERMAKIYPDAKAVGADGSWTKRSDL